MSDQDWQELQKLRSEYPAALAEIKRLQALVEQLATHMEESLKANEELRKLLTDLQAKLDTLVVQQKKRNRRDYGKKTERYNPRPALQDDVRDAAVSSARIRDKARLDQINGLPEAIKSYAVPDNERQCPECGAEKVKIGDEISYQLERLVGTMKRLRHVQEVLACPKCRGNVVVAPKPEPPFPKSTAAPGLLSHVIVSKYTDFSPLYRLERIYRREGAPIPRSTLSDWILSGSLTLEPLYDLQVKRVFQSKVIGTDDTTVKIQDREIDKNIRKGKMTPYIGDKNNPYNIFDFSPNESFERNKKMFKGYTGFVQCDAAGGFDAIFDDGSCIEVGCNAHSRRKYFECQVVSPKNAEEILQIYRDIYNVERRAHEDGVSADKLLRMRQTESKPLFDGLQEKLLKMQVAELPQSPMAKAINYTLNHWTALTRYLDDPDLAIDNNITERAVKEFVLGRKNFLFVGSDAGGKAAAICLSILSSAKRNDVEPWAYLKDIFSRINNARTTDLDQFLPDVWLKSQKSQVDSS
jgi:transposase